jgi:hypothetical protein
MGVRIHLFHIQNQDEWIQLKQILALHNKPYEGSDETIKICCFMQYEDAIFVECTAYGSQQTTIDFLRSKLGDRYSPPWEKPDWYEACHIDSPKRAVSKLKKSDVSFDKIRASFPEKSPITN